MTDTEIAVRFAELFHGNDRAFGTEDGGCERGDPDLTTAGRWNDYLTRIEDHLEGRTPMGVYPMVRRGWPEGDWAVNWGCIDFDEGEDESWAHARNCQLLLDQFGVQAHVERSRSKGYHVWVFMAEWTPAKLMREALLAACQIVNAPTREINPKQVELEDGQLGNYVRLPYPGALSNDGMTVDLRRMVVDRHRVMLTLDEWLDGVVEITASHLEQVQALYEPPMKRRPKLDPNAYAPDAESYMTPYLRAAYEQGPGEDVADRSATLWRFACMLAESGRVPEEAAVELVTAYDEKWLGKFVDRLDSERTIEQLVGKAYL